jgi:hypothetical protein
MMNCWYDDGDDYCRVSIVERSETVSIIILYYCIIILYYYIMILPTIIIVYYRVSPQGGEAVVINRTQRQRSEAAVGSSCSYSKLRFKWLYHHYY